MANWYNKPFASQQGNEPLNLISDAFWKRSTPEIIEQTQEQCCDLSQGDAKLVRKIKEYLAHTADKRVDEIDIEQDIGSDLGLDSLDIAALITYLEQHFSIRNISPEELTTVASVIYFAAEAGSKIPICL